MTNREDQLIEVIRRALSVPDVWDKAVIMTDILSQGLNGLAPKEGADKHEPV